MGEPKLDRALRNKINAYASVCEMMGLMSRYADPKMEEIRQYRREKLERAIAARIAQAKAK